jgi:hypothetical protein
MRHPIRGYQNDPSSQPFPLVAFPVRCNAHPSAQNMFVIPRKDDRAFACKSGHIRNIWEACRYVTGELWIGSSSCARCGICHGSQS